MRSIVLLSLVLACSAAFAQTYKWTDSAGRTVISDTPPTGLAKKVSKSSDTAQADDNLPFSVKKAMEAFPVVLYTSNDCGDSCKQARDLLNSRGVPFTEKDVQKTAERDELKQLIGEAFVPTIKVGNQRQRGFEAGAYDNLLDLAGYPKTAPYGAKKADDKK